MICQTTQKDTIHKNRFSLSLHSSPVNDITKRHSSYHQDIKKVFPLESATSSSNPAFIKCRDSNINQNEQNQQPNNNKRDFNSHQYWEKIESYYVNRLDSLAKEIETSTAQNTKLSAVRDELLQEILQLHQKSVELNNKNESLIRSIAEKENHISAFMYNEKQQQTQPRSDNSSNNGGFIGVTLVDKPYSSSIHNEEEIIAATSNIINEYKISSSNNNNTSTTTKKEISNGQPGIFRQISLRLSNRKRRQQDDSSSASNSNAPLNISEPIVTNNNSHQPNITIPVASSSEPLLHPAAVMASTVAPSSIDYEENGYKRKNVLFGSDLIQQAKSENSVIPTIVLKCIREVELRGLSVEGIYRKSGTFAQIKDLQDAFEGNKNPKLSKYQDINVIASVLKLYFRELNTPLIPNDFILPSTMNSQERLNKTYSLLHNMPIEPYCTIKFLVQHLKRVHQNHATNRMTSKNLAVVFGPTLMRFIAGNEEQQMRDMINTVDYIILQSHTLFADYHS